jgi:hypothetical protein
MKKLLLTVTCIYLTGLYLPVLAQYTPITSPPNPGVSNDNGTSVPVAVPTSYYDKNNSGTNLLSWSAAELTTRQKYRPVGIKMPNYTGTMNFRLLYPYNYNPAKKYPLVLFFHGKGEGGGTAGGCGSGNCAGNNDKNLEHWGRQMIRANEGGANTSPYNNTVPYDKNYAAFYLVPQENDGYWSGNGTENGYMRYIEPSTGQPSVISGNMDRAIAMVDFLVNGGIIQGDAAALSIDPNRIYVHGLSQGGGGTMDAVYRRPDLFAAADGYSVGGDRSAYVSDLVKYIPIWVWQGGQDTNPIYTVSKEVFNNYAAVAPLKRDKQDQYMTYASSTSGPYVGAYEDRYIGNKRYTLIPTVGHGTWYNAYDHKDMFRWLFSRTKLEIAAFGDTALSTGQSTTLGIQSGYEAYEWAYSSDGVVANYTTTLPGGVTNGNNTITVSTIGYYRVRFKRKNPYTLAVYDWTDWSNPIQIINNITPTVTFYPKATGDLATLSTWGVNADGTGTAPTNFTNPSQTFIINRAGSIGSSWTVSGSASKIIINSTGSFTIPSGIYITGTAPINVQAGGYLTVNSLTMLPLGTVDNASTVEFGGGLTIPVPTGGSYGNVVLSGTEPNNIAGNNIVINGNLTITGPAQNATANASIELKGNLIINSTSAQLPLTLIANAPGVTLLGNGNNFTLGGITITNGNNLLIDNLPTLTMTGPVNAGGQTGTMGFSNGVSITINYNSTTPSYYYFNPSQNTLTNLNITKQSSGSINIQNELKVTGTVKLSTGDLNTSAGSLVLVSNASGSGRLDKVENGASYTGNLTVQRYFSGSTTSTKGWFHVGTSVKGQTVNDWNDDAKLVGLWMGNITSNVQYHRENAYGNYPSTSVYAYQNEGWMTVSSLSDAITPGKGYRFYAYNEFFNSPRTATLTNTGQPVIGDGTNGVNTNGTEAFTFTVTYNSSGWPAGSDGGWNCLSNPYPSDIVWEQPATNRWTRSSNITPTIYVWDAKSNSGKGQWTSFNSSTLAATNGGINRIAMGQSFFVKATSSTSLSLRLTENVKTSTATVLLKTGNSMDYTLHVGIKNSAGYTDEALVAIYPQSTGKFDEETDAYKLYGGPVNISSLTTDSINVSVNGISGTESRVKLNVSENAKGSYTLNFTGQDNFGTKTSIYLIDNYTAQTINVSRNPSYSFTITDDANSTGSSRFALVFGVMTEAIETIDPIISLHQNTPNPFDDETVIGFNLPSEGIVSFSIYNTLGKKIDTITMDGKAGGNTLVWNPAQRTGKVLENGIYIYKLQFGNQSLTRKMMIAR